MIWDVAGVLKLGEEIQSSPERMITAIEAHMKVRNRNGKVIPLKANTVQRTFEQKKERRNIVLKARQMGITTWVAARMFMKTITTSGTLTVQVAQTREAAEGIFRMVQRFWEHLPKDAREGPLRRSRANVGQMCFPELDSEFRILSADATGAGRGLSIQNLHLSEVSRWPGDAQETLAGLRAALSPSGEMVIESTPNGAYGCFYNEWNRAEANGTRRHFFPWWMEEVYVSDPVTDFTDEEKVLVLAHGLKDEQIGFRRALEASYQGLRSQEFAEDAVSCFRATGDCYFEVGPIEKRIELAPKPLEIRRGGALHIWLPPQSDRRYIVAADTAGGGSEGDFAAVQVVEISTGLQCAELQQRLGPLELAQAVASLAREYNNAQIAVERNNHGAAVLAYLSTVEHYANVYEMDGVAGWLTTAGNKPNMIAQLGSLLVDSPWRFMSRRLLEECRTFVRMANGRTGAANGAHDDCVMAMAIAQSVRAEMLR
ncbi:phage terminase large subunit family protein [Edaphobacter albus]|uniref:phage terminase large subunit family protein n=1 Tax=Edaphobacter sp. 4G125 TaxID=2763071 RepID=UPI001644E3ED|nr:terminase [Edaphobacter sp. 4G125]QNI36817.1 terminase [Edaphobacter sp. 4G125]